MLEKLEAEAGELPQVKIGFMTVSYNSFLKFLNVSAQGHRHEGKAGNLCTSGYFIRCPNAVHAVDRRDVCEFSPA